MSRRSCVAGSTRPGSLFTWRCISLAFMLAVRARGGGLFSSASPVDEVSGRGGHVCMRARQKSKPERQVNDPRSSLAR